MSKLTFILGGSRSGKSKFAEQCAEKSTRKVVYVATCRTDLLDPEMRERIDRHKSQRPSHWQTVENQFDLKQLAQEFSGHVLLIDCLTLWLSNEMEHNDDTQLILQKLESGLRHFKNNDVETIIVSNELGMGIVPVSSETRQYRDLVGWANQLVARYADSVQFIVAGLPLILKE